MKNSEPGIGWEISASSYLESKLSLGGMGDGGSPVNSPARFSRDAAVKLLGRCSCVLSASSYAFWASMSLSLIFY